MSTRASRNAQRSQSAKVHHYVNRQLDKTRRQVKSTELIAHLLVVTIFVIGFLQLMALVDAWVWSFNSVARWLSFIFLVVAAVGYLLLTVCPLLLRKIHPDYAAKMIEEVQPTFKNSLLNYVSLRKQPKATHAAVMDAVTKQAAIDLQTVPEDATVDRSSIVRIGFYLLGLIAFVAFYWMLSPKDPLQSFSRILLPSSKKSAPSIVQVTDVSPGDHEVFFGDPVVVSATIKGQFSPEDVRLVYSTLDGQVVDQVLTMQPQTTSSNRYEATLTTPQGGVVRGMVYKVIARDGVSPDYEIVVRPNPSITLASAEVTPPAYTLLRPEIVSGQGAIEVVEGSLLKLNAVANLPIKLAYIELLVKHPQDKNEFVVVETVSMVVNETEAHGEFHAIYNYQAQKQRATHFRLKFRSTEGDANQNANVHPLRIVADLVPQIEVLNPIQNTIKMPINETLLIDVRATDTDYGISSIELEMQSNGTNLFRKKKLPLQSEKGKKRVRGQFQFTPGKHFVRAGETVVFTATASDNRTSYLSGALDPNQTITREYKIEILDAVNNPKRPSPSDPNDSRENPPKNDPSEQGEQGESERGDSGDSGEAGSSAGDGDAGEQSESGEEGESSGASESGESGGEAGDSNSQGQPSGDQSDASEGGDGETPGDSDPKNGGQETGDSQGESSDNADNAENAGTGAENAGANSAGSEGGSESSGQQDRAGEGANQNEPSDGGPEGSGARGDNTQGSESQSEASTGDAQEAGDPSGSAGSEDRAQDRDQGSESRSDQEGGNQGSEGARKPLGDDAADGDVMSRMEEIMQEEKSKEGKSKQGNAAGEKTNGQDQSPAEQNTGSGTDPKQKNPRQSEGTGAMQQNDAQQPPDAQGGDNNAQRGEGQSSSSQGQQNGTAKGSSGSETGDQSQEGASSEDSNTGQSDETGGNDPGNADADSSGENQQEAGASGSGESGSSGQSSQEGAKPSQEAGEGSTGAQKSGGDEGGKQGGGEQGSGEQGGGEQGGGEQGGAASGESAAGQGQSSGAPSSSESQPSDTPGSAGGSSGNGPGGETIAEKENAAHSKKTTDMVLKRLEEERFEPDPDILKELNWSKEDLNQFLDRWQKMKAAAETGDPVARQRYDKALKSLGLSSDSSQEKVRGVSDQQEGFNTDSAVNRPPQEIAPGYRAFKRARNRSKN